MKCTKVGGSSSSNEHFYRRGRRKPSQVWRNHVTGTGTSCWILSTTFYPFQLMTIVDSESSPSKHVCTLTSFVFIADIKAVHHPPPSPFPTLTSWCSLLTASCRGVLPSMSVHHPPPSPFPTLTSWCSLLTASCRGVLPSMSVHHPPPSPIPTLTSWCSLLTASCRGVLPSMSVQLMLKSLSWSSMKRSVCTSPVSAADSNSCSRMRDYKKMAANLKFRMILKC